MSKKPRLTLDFLVIGGGAAGSACANRLSRGGARAAIIETTDFSRYRVGEIIAPSARRPLSQLGVGPEVLCDWCAPCTGVAAAWGQPSAAQRPSLFNPYGRGWRVDRRAFDRMLFEQARYAGAFALTRCRLSSATRQAGRWCFTLETAAGPVRGSVAWIIAATGRSASAPLAPSRSRLLIDRLVGIALLDDSGDRDAAEDAAMLVEAAPCGWWYSVSIPDGGRLAVFLTDADLLPSGRRERGNFLHEQLLRSPLTRGRCEFVEHRIGHGRWTGFDARSGIRRVVVCDGWVAIGDAAMAFDPLCGRGVAEALRSGIEVAEWLLQSSPAQENGVPDWVGETARRFNEYCAQRLSNYGREGRWIDLPFWRRRQLA
jgi:flavin-dependent dehydrogenase